MKKSLVVMALMCGAVVFVAACGKKNTEDCKTCTITIENRNDSEPATGSKAYPNGKYCDDALKGVEGKNGSAAADGDATDSKNKGGKYKVDCQ